MSQAASGIRSRPLLRQGEFFGHEHYARSVGSLLFTDVRYRPQYETPVHRHEQAYVSILIRGEYQQRSPTGVRHCVAGDVLFHPAGEWHADSFGGRGGECLNVEMPLDWLRSVFQDVRLPACTLQVSVGCVSTAITNEFRWREHSSALVMESLATALLGCVLRDRSRVEQGPRWLRRVIDYLETRPLDEMVGLTILSQVAGVSAAHVVRTFRAHYGCTPGEYARRRAIKRAAERLVNSAASIAEIAAETGFADHSHFTRTFRRIQGITPREYRRRTQ